ncbi:MAG: DNA repair exonuclease [Ktedonobacteraceae bacterium]
MFYKMTEQENNSQELANSNNEQQRNVVTVVLTADNHLGYDSPAQHKREEQQQRLRDAFQQAVTFAIGQKADLFIQAGDLFATPTPTERDRNFVSARLVQLKQAGIRVIALGGTHDTPVEAQEGKLPSAPQMSYAQLGLLEYLPSVRPDRELEPLMFETHGVLVGICGLNSFTGQEGSLLPQLLVQSEIERAAIPILVLHAPLESRTNSISQLEKRAQMNRASIAQQQIFRYILAGYDHTYSHTRIGQTEVIVAGATHSTPSIHETQQENDTTPNAHPGFVFMGLTADSLRWCNHITVDALQTKRLSITTKELWLDKADAKPTEHILERLEPLCDAESIILLRLEGELTRRQYHQLDLNTIRHYGEEYCFSLAIDDSNVSLISEQDTIFAETGERFSPREELIAVAEEWIADTEDEQEKKALRNTKDELLLALDDSRGRR